MRLLMKNVDTGETIDIQWGPGSPIALLEPVIYRLEHGNKPLDPYQKAKDAGISDERIAELGLTPRADS